MPRNCVVFCLPRRLIRSSIYRWPIVLVRDVNRRPCNVEWYLCGSLNIILTIYAFHNKRFQALFIDQLVRSKATCSFNLARDKRLLSSTRPTQNSYNHNHSLLQIVIIAKQISYNINCCLNTLGFVKHKLLSSVRLCILCPVRVIPITVCNDHRPLSPNDSC